MRLPAVRHFSREMANSSRENCGESRIRHTFGHHGQFTTMREAVLTGHNGEASASRIAFQSFPAYDQDSIIEFLKSLQILPEGTHSLCVNQDGKERNCPAGILP